MSELIYQDFFIKLIAEFPEMPRTAIWLDKYGEKLFASWGGITQEDILFGVVLAGKELGQRFSLEASIGSFRYSLTFASDGVFLIVDVEKTVAGFVFDKINAVDDLLLILKECRDAMRLKLHEPKSP